MHHGGCSVELDGWFCPCWKFQPMNKDLLEPAHDLVNHPPHYNSHPSGVECIDVVEHMTFCQGNAIKYAWRAGLKGDAIEDFEKSAWYAKREADRLRKLKAK
jgi:hypothetical protein